MRTCEEQDNWRQALDPKIAETIDEICERAGTQDVHGDVLVAAAEIILEARGWIKTWVYR